MSITGEKPGKGTYECKVCNTTMVIDGVKDTLTICPKCNNTKFDRIA